MQGEDLNPKLKLSPFAFIFTRKPHIALYNSINMEIVFGGAHLLRLITLLNSPTSIENVLMEFDESLHKAVREAINHLLRKKIIVDPSSDQLRGIQRLRERVIRSSKLSVLYLFLTTQCNLRCQYCHIMDVLTNKDSYSIMTEETARQAINLFARYTKLNDERKEIVFYGGEPLLNYHTIFFTIEYIRELEKRGSFRGEVGITIFTNGTLVKPSIAEFLAKNNVFVIVSLDGPEKVNDKMRVYPTGKGTFKDILRGYHICKAVGCKVGISTTVGSHNVNQLSSIINYFKDELDPVDIGLSTLHRQTSGGNIAFVCAEHLTEKLIVAYIAAREHGIYIEHMIRRIRPFVEQTPRYKDCPSCGGKILVAPDGQIGLCEAFIGSRTFFLGSCDDSNDLLASQTYQEWNKRFPLNMDECLRCPAISICGGGCPYDAYVIYRSIWSLDYFRCTQSKIILDWLIWDLFGKIKRPFRNKRLFISPKRSNRRLIYGNIKVNSSSLPLQDYSRYGEKIVR